MTLSPYLSKVVADIRQDVRYSLIEVWKESEQQTSADDAYGRTSVITSGARFFSGSLGWVKTQERQNTSGGFYRTGDVDISAALADKSVGDISLDDDDVYLVAENVKLKIVKITEATDTKDMVISCERISEK